MSRSLVIDNSRVIRKVARALLENMRFETAEAEHSAGALDYCRTEMPDLILFDMDDVQPGGCSRTEFLRQLRRQPNGKHPRVVLCTTENDPDHIAAGLAAGADEFVQKPFDRAALQSTLAGVGFA